jgi:hypothetical protein
MRVFQDGCACGNNRLLGVQTIAEVVGDHVSNQKPANRRRLHFRGWS